MSTSIAAAAKKGPYHHGDLRNALIKAGVDILSREGVSGLSLRRVAQKAGVSHAAPYAHFADKEALVAAISTEGYRRLYEVIRRATDRRRDDPAAQLVEGAWAYVKFAMDDPDSFRMTMPGAVEREKDYPELVAVSQATFALVVDVVSACQKKKVLKPGPPDVVAVGVWSMLHGLVSLLLKNQVPHAVTDRLPVRDLLVELLGQISARPLCSPRRC